MDRQICGWIGIGLCTTIDLIAAETRNQLLQNQVRTWLWLSGSVANYFLVPATI